MMLHKNRTHNSHNLTRDRIMRVIVPITLFIALEGEAFEPGNYYEVLTCMDKENG